MPKFNGIVITDKGKELLAKAQTGKVLNFSKVQLGSNADTSSLTTKTEVIAPFLTTDIIELKSTEDGKARISTYISNESLETDCVWREIGLFAIDPDTNDEILYAYGCAGENGETLPKSGGPDIVEKVFDIIINVSGVSTITASIDGSIVYLKTRDIVVEFDSCDGESEKVPSAQLFFNKVKELLDAHIEIGNDIDDLDESLTDKINAIDSSLRNTISSNKTELNTLIAKKLTYADFAITQTNTFSISNGHGGYGNHSTTITKSGYYPLGIVGHKSTSTNHYNNTAMGPCITELYLTNQKTGSCNINAKTYVANNSDWTYSSTYSAYILWVKVT